MDDVHVIKNFFGVYLLYCKNPRYIGRTYIGYTVDPNRRIKQHNKGKKAGGAWRTSNRGPWSMVLIVHGFPNDIAALRFEWAWQHPHSSRRLHHVAKKKAKEKSYDFCIRVLSDMLRVGPWNRLPLTVRWLNQEFIREFPAATTPPMHMPICYGPVISKKTTKNSSQSEIENDNIYFCDICNNIIENKKVSCLNMNCDLVSHIICLSKFFKTENHYVPIEGKCPKCKLEYLWGDIVRKYKNCYNNCDLKINLEDENGFVGSDSD